MPTQLSQKEIEAKESICPLSMANPNGPLYCQGSVCFAWSRPGCCCVIISSASTTGYNMRLIGNYLLNRQHQQRQQERPNDPQEHGL